MRVIQRAEYSDERFLRPDSVNINATKKECKRHKDTMRITKMGRKGNDAASFSIDFFKNNHGFTDLQTKFLFLYKIMV